MHMRLESFVLLWVSHYGKIELASFDVQLSQAREVGENNPKLREALAAMPNAEPEVIASIVSYLAKPESYFVNGQSVSVNGGGYFD
ncbi:uncharacterized protein FOMMEDRAFT_164011 [Fomitiporia mediterranea MF3/22]|uniref:NAD(P)-binding protein n=1 Tax=Fomitiporia mediterranea (strain MF3/22) TaxID=694068 RepID=R7SG98_FOMME|nr:uncharacterized protein FOMMEDRAFT_164011 [Fomitiporia mediterranea MF3/22]EJC97307.1 hypothetical protein FOMMEDRAFT_164011 [Fomitiporia mediterranea MF3/22]